MACEKIKTSCSESLKTFQPETRSFRKKKIFTNDLIIFAYSIRQEQVCRSGFSFLLHDPKHKNFIIHIILLELNKQWKSDKKTVKIELRVLMLRCWKHFFWGSAKIFMRRKKRSGKI